MPEDAEQEKGKLASAACAVLMKILYGARMARWDLLKVVSMLAQRVTKWTTSCDKALHRLVCYIDTSKDLVLTGHVGDKMEDLNLQLFADADFAGCKVTYRSTSGMCMFLHGKNTLFPLQLHPRSNPVFPTARLRQRSLPQTPPFELQDFLCSTSGNAYSRGRSTSTLWRTTTRA